METEGDSEVKDWKGFKRNSKRIRKEFDANGFGSKTMDTRKIDTAATGNIEIGNEAMENSEMEVGPS